MNINPQAALHFGYIKPTADTKAQQVGIDITAKTDVAIQPKGFVQIETAETVDMQDTFGLIVQRSTFNRQGIMIRGTIIDPGYKGSIWLTIYNFRDERIAIYKGTRIAQVIFFGANYAALYEGQYQGGKTVE